MSTLHERALPQNLDAERAILGGVLVDNSQLDAAVELVRPEHFFRAGHRQIYERLLAMSGRRQAMDLLTLVDDLRKAQLLDEVGGPAYVSALIDGVPRGTNVAAYARIVREKADLRALIIGANRMLTAAYEGQEDVQTILGKAEQQILGLADHATTTGFEAMKTIAARGLDLLEKAGQQKQVVVGVPSGVDALDDITRGWHPGKLVTIGARPGVGKSSFGEQVAIHAARLGYPTGYSSLEMEKDELFVRGVAQLAQVDSYRLTTGHLTDRDYGRIAMAVGELAEAPLFIDETPAVNLFELTSRARKLKAEHGLRLLVVDYLQLMSSTERLNNRALELGAITGGLKEIAKELKITVILLSQLSRDVEKRGGRPKLSDLRDSGSIEQDSDIILFLHRDESQDSADAVTELIIAKHRGGPVGTVKLRWFDAQTRFENYVTYHEPQDQRLGDR